VASALPAVGAVAEAAEPDPASMSTEALFAAKEHAVEACCEAAQRHSAVTRELERRGAIEREPLPGEG
jgi:hypothetical protein